MAFKGLVVDKDDEGKVHQTIKDVDDADLPPGDVTVRVQHTTLNYKDGLCLWGKGGLVRNFPHIPGIDFAGVVESSDDRRFSAGDSVILTGWRVGENRWGGYGEKARVMADWLVPMPKGMDSRQAMAIGTAGLTAMISVMALEEHAVNSDSGPVLVTGAAGGVGSVAVKLLSSLGFEVAAVTGRPETADYLQELGATEIVERAELSEPNSKPLESERWAGCVDAVGGEMLGRVLKQMKSGGSVAAVGLAGGAAVPSFTVVPFLLRGVNLLGIDSVMCPIDRRITAWNRLSELLDPSFFEKTATDHELADLPGLGREILAGQVKGRVVVGL